ncbi:MAG: drug/metabolite transporter (DMT)-like permease, partial [Parasphingorhabdus sp.]
MAINPPQKPIVGIFAMFLAMAMLPVVDALLKSLVDVYSAEQITWIRNIVHAGLLLPWIIFVKERGALS